MEEKTLQKTDELKKTEKKNGNKKVLLLIAIAIVVIVGFVVFSGPEKVELKEYLNANPEISGFSGHATIDMNTRLWNNYLMRVLLVMQNTIHMSRL